MPYGLENIDQIKQATALKARIKQLIQQELEDGMDPLDINALPSR